MAELKRRLLNEGWRFRAVSWPAPPARLGFSRMEWLDAQVPGSVHLDLIRWGVISDPFAALGELGCQWVDEDTWIYRSTFQLHREPSLPRQLLRFSGLDTVCTISVDGERLASHDNMFRELELDVSHLDDGDHELEIVFSPASQVGGARRAAYFEQEALLPNTTHFDERAFVRKPQYMFGWDWGPRLVSAGLFRPVELLSFEARLLDVWVLQRHDSTGAAYLDLRSQVDARELSDDVAVVHFVHAPNGEQLSAALTDDSTFTVLTPALWWPSGSGKQPLYTIHSYLIATEHSPSTAAAAARLAFDHRKTRVGLRTVELRQRPDDLGESFEFLVNGHPIYALGANFIPDHSFPAAVSVERYRTRLQEAKSLGMNMLRVWGGGLYETDDFYDLADELGLLIWQDFPFACSHYPDGAPERAAAGAEAAENIVRLRNHASLALWCGNNENQEMFDKGWEGRDRHPGRLHGQPLYEQILPDTVRDLDPGRPYVRSSPDRGKLASDGGYGDEHYWDVWHGRGDWKHYEDSTGRFASEFGFASAPGPRTFARIRPDALAQSPFELSSRFHDKTMKGFDTFSRLVELHYPKAQTNEEWLYSSQLNQRDALRCGIEHFRRVGYCRGTLIWQLNDCWPAQSWAVLDDSGDRKAAAFELVRLYQNVLVSLRILGDRCEVWGIVDNQVGPAAISVVLTARRLSDGEVARTWTKDLCLDDGERRLLFEADLSGLDRTSTLLSASYCGMETHRLLCEPKEAKCPLPQLTISVTDDELVVVTSTPVCDLFVWDPEGRVTFRNNFLTVPFPGSFRLRADGLQGSATRLQARCLAGKVSPRF